MAPKRTFTDTEKTQITQWYVNDILSFREIASRLGVSHHIISRCVRAWNLVRKPSQWNRICPLCKETIHYRTLRSYYNNKNSDVPCIVCSNGRKTKGHKYGQDRKHQISERQKEQARRDGSRITLVCKLPDCDISWEQRKSSPKVFCSFSHAMEYQFRYIKHAISLPEGELAKLLDMLNIPYEQQYKLGGKFFDFYLPSKRLLIEVDGIFWHSRGVEEDCLYNVQRRIRHNDKLKNEIAKDNGYELLRLWEDEIDLVSEYLY